MKYLNWLFVLVLVLISSCHYIEDTTPTYEYKLSVSGVLEQDGRSFLPKDKNGYYRLKLIRNNQQPHRITGTILENGIEARYSQLLKWESNLYWWIGDGDTVANITKTYVNIFTGEFTIIQLPPLVSNKDELVPTINGTSYSGSDGVFNTMISPIRDMVGDTLIVKVTHIESKKYEILKIVLE
jgi:hypothetical protein